MNTNDFVSQLWQLGLLHNRHLERAVEEGRRRVRDARGLARELIQQNMLTPYQANQILTGKAHLLIVGKYRLIERLGPGSLGPSFKARHMAMGRLVTLQRPPEELAGDPRAQARIQGVVQVLARAAHPNLPVAYDAFEERGVAVLVQEHVNGTRLDRWVRTQGPLAAGLACHAVRQTASALQYVFDQGLKCPHIQPSGILLVQPSVEKRAGEDVPGAVPSSRWLAVKIVDLGLPLPAGGAAPPHRDSDTIGPADFVAPEQVSSRPVVDLRTLVYRLGGILYFTLTGRTPFPEGQAWTKMLRHQFREPEPVEHVRPEVPAPLAALTRRMLAKKPENRYKTLTEVAADLARLDSTAEIAAHAR